MRAVITILILLAATTANAQVFGTYDIDTGDIIFDIPESATSFTALITLRMSPNDSRDYRQRSWNERDLGPFPEQMVVSDWAKPDGEISSPFVPWGWIHSSPVMYGPYTYYEQTCADPSCLEAYYERTLMTMVPEPAGFWMGVLGFVVLVTASRIYRMGGE